MTSPADIVDLRAHRLLDSWERAQPEHRTVTWCGERLVAVDKQTGEVWRASGRVELAAEMRLGILA